MTALPRILTAITFQSTPSVWRETLQAATTLLMAIVFQSTPSVWRETLLITAGSQSLVISIHSLRVEGDLVRLWMPFRNCYFNPLPPCGGRRGQTAEYCGRKPISIHSLRVEGDRAAGCPAKLHDRFQSTPSVWRETDQQRGHRNGVIHDFNPLPPCGGRQRMAPAIRHHALFQSTPSVWRETASLTTILTSTTISIHSLRVEGDTFVV